MQKGYFQKAISAVSLAVLTGVVLFSVGSGTSATPEYAPPGSGVSPTFNGVTVTGDMNIAGKIKDPKGNGIINLENHLDVLGEVKAMSVNAGKLKNGTPTDGGWVNVDDKFSVTQNSNFKGNVIIENTLSVWDAITSLNGLIKTNKVQSGVIDVTGTGIENSDAVSNGGAVKINDALDVTGVIKNSIANVKFDDSVEIGASYGGTKSLTVYGNLTLANGNNCVQGQDCAAGSAYNSDLTVSGNALITGAAQVNEDLTMKGNILLGNKAIGLGSTAEGFIQQGSQLTIASMPNTDIELIAGNARIWMKKAGTVEVQGKLVATKGIGTYTRRVSTDISVSSGSTSYTSKSCNSGEIAISCGVYPSSYKLYNSYFYTNSDMTTCYVGVHNTDSATKTFKVHATCFNPAI